MLKRSTVLSRIAAAALAVAAAICASVAVAQAPAADALKQIIDEANPAYLNSSTPLSDRERIATLYEANGYRLLWSDGAQPTQAAIDLLQGSRLGPARLPRRAPGVFVDGLAGYAAFRTGAMGAV